MIEAFAVRRVSALSDAAINELLDAHLFGHSPLCLGLSVNDGTGVWRCQWCGEVDDRAVASCIFDLQPWHRKAVPSYTIAEIVEKLRDYDKSTQIVYMFSLKSQILGVTTQTIRRDPLTEYTQIMMHYNDDVRRVGVAALTALGIVDEQGFIRE